MQTYIFSLFLLLATGSHAIAQDAVYLIRHGEKELSGGDPALTPEGRKRAADWAEMLGNVGVDAVLTTDALRTKETGGIIAAELDLEANALPTNNVAGLVDTLEFDHEGETVLVVAHAETIPRILELLGVLESITVEQSEFDNLFIVQRPSSEEPVFIHLIMP
jgi:broad specificity phosphatase PhoE